MSLWSCAGNWAQVQLETCRHTAIIRDIYTEHSSAYCRLYPHPLLYLAGS